MKKNERFSRFFFVILVMFDFGRAGFGAAGYSKGFGM